MGGWAHWTSKEGGEVQSSIACRVSSRRAFAHRASASRCIRSSSAARSAAFAAAAAASAAALAAASRAPSAESSRALVVGGDDNFTALLCAAFYNDLRDEG